METHEREPGIRSPNGTSRLDSVGLVTNKQKVQRAFTTLINEGQVDPATIAEHFSPHYRQWVDGKELDYQGFIEHMQALRAAVTSMHVDFTTVIEEGDAVASSHTVTAQKRDGSFTRGRVIAIFRVGDDGIRSCQELTYLEEGDESDKDLGSRT